MKLTIGVKSLPRLKGKKEPAVAISPEGQAFVEEVDALADEVWEEGRTIVPALASPPEDERKAKHIKRTANGFFIGAACVCVLLALTMMLNAYAANGVFGLRFFVEPTDAMKPAIPRGSLLVTVNRKPDKINQGDIITYNALRDEPLTRLTRIVEERTGPDGNYRFRTKRPGNTPPDSLIVNVTNILGVKLFVVPYGGYVISFMRIYAGGFAGLAAALCAAAVLLRKWLRPITRKASARKERDDVETLL